MKKAGSVQYIMLDANDKKYMKELTRFQTKCETELIEALKRVGRHLVERRLEGISEIYVRAKVSETELTVFIYEDEANVQGPQTDLRFEAPDYDSGKELTRDFVSNVINLVK